MHVFVVSRIMDKHLKTLSLKHIDTKFIKLDAEVSMNNCIYRDDLVFSQS